MLAAATAHAEDVVAYQAEGDAPAIGADPRTAALDDAFAHATASALADLVPPDALAAHKADLDREIIQHARLWVVKFSVTRDQTDADRRELSVSVKIDRDRLRAKLQQLGVPVQDATAVPDAAAATHTAAILLRVTTPDGAHANFGASAEPDVPGLAALTAAAHDAGFAIRSVTAVGPPAGSGNPGDGQLTAMLDDQSAATLAADAKAELALVAGVTVGPPVPVRGQPATAQLVTAHVRLIDARQHQALGQGAATTAALGDGTLATAAGAAVMAAAADALPPAPARLAQAGAYRGDDAPIAEPGVVLVRLPAHTPLALVLDEQHFLAGARGVRGAMLRRMSPRGWVIGVQTDQPPEQVAQLARRPPAADTSVEVKIAGGIVEVTLSGAP